MSDALTGGTIETEQIAAARETMHQIVKRFMEIKNQVNQTSQNLCEDWVGEGRNEYEAQYQLLISKVSDIGDSLEEMYQALVDAQAAYEETDRSYNQQVVMAMQDAGYSMSG